MNNEIRVLHVDDEPSFAEVSASLLEREDSRFSVDIATRPADGLRLLERHHFDCIVSDYDMPTTSGIDLLRQVRNDHPDLPFILFTGNGSEDIASEAVSAGVTDYLQKSRGTDCFALLANRIANAVEHYHTTQQLERINNLREALTELSIEILGHPCVEIDEQIDTALSTIGEAACADRSYLFSFDFEDETATNTHEWCRPGVEPQIQDLQGFSLERIDWMVDHLDRSEAISIPKVSELPSAAASEQRILEDGDIESVVVAPLVEGDELVGLIGFDWLDQQSIPDDLIDTLEMVGHLLVSAQTRRRQERQLRARTQQLEAVLHNVDAAIWMRDADSRYLLMNQNYRELYGIDPDTDVHGRRPSDLLPVDSSNKFQENDRMVLEREEPVDIERTLTIDGEERTFMVHLAPLFDGDELHAICGVATELVSTHRVANR